MTSDFALEVSKYPKSSTKPPNGILITKRVCEPIVSLR